MRRVRHVLRDQVIHYSIDEVGDAAITGPWNAFRLQFGIRSTRVLEGRDW